MDPGKSSQSRVFLIEGGARPDHTADYMDCMRGGGHSQDFGEPAKIECPSPDAYNQYDEKGDIPGEIGRPTNTLTARFARDTASDLHRLARLGCPVDVQLHFGQCKSPKSFEEFDKVFIYEKAFLTNYTTDEMGALESGERVAINDSADISARKTYEVVPMNFAQRANSIVTNEVVDVTICDGVSCGECEDQSDGCKKIYAITEAAGGSAGTPPDLVYSLDKGVTWHAHDIDSLLTAQTPTGIACVGDYLVVVSNDSGSLHYILKSDVRIDEDHTWVQQDAGFVVGGEPNAIFGVGDMGFIVGDAGYIYKVENPADGVTVLDPGSAVASNLLDVYALDEKFAVAVGEAGVMAKTENGSIWTPVIPSPVGVGINFNAVYLVDESTWLLAGSNGTLYWTVDGGDDWSTTVFAGLTVITDVKMASNSIGRLSGYNATIGKIYETINGGNTWKILPRGNQALSLVDQINAIALCSSDENFMVAVGLADGGTDGVILLGED